MRHRLLALGLILLAACSGRSGAVPAHPATTRAAAASPGSGSGFSVAAENARPGVAPARWNLHDAATDRSLAGYFGRTSVVAGQPVVLYVKAATPYRVRAFRMGFYGGDEAREVWVSATQPPRAQPADTVEQLQGRTTNTVVDHWRPSLTVDTRGFPPGDYLFRLDGSGGKQWFVPLTVRAARPPAHPVVIINAVTTWQAYNSWGGYDLYQGPNGAFRTRARIVSFDRPYQLGDGSGDFLGNELPALALAERLGLPLEYATSVDVQENPHLLDGARAVLSLGHDEYWSSRMRAAVTAARDAGANVAFLGANAVYRHIRFAASTSGPDRLEICYKVAREDPEYGVDNAAVTVNWPSPPVSRPESSLTGAMYQCNPVRAPLVVADPTSWLFATVRVSAGEALPGLVGSEFDRVDLAYPTPRPIEVVFHSPVACDGRPNASDAVVYTAPSGADVFDSGTSDWVCALADACRSGRGDARAQRVVSAVTTTLLRAFAAGPAGRVHPARDNVAALTRGGALP